MIIKSYRAQNKIFNTPARVISMTMFVIFEALLAVGAYLDPAQPPAADQRRFGHAVPGLEWFGPILVVCAAIAVGVLLALVVAIVVELLCRLLRLVFRR